jgi:endonuclease-3
VTEVGGPEERPDAATAEARPPLSLVRRARRIHRALGVRYPDARCELDFRTPFQLLVATVLSAQTTDVRVNSVTPALFHLAPDPAAMVALDRSRLEEVLRPVGFYRAKAASVQGLSALLLERHRGEVPRRLEALVALPGVGRKTANVVRGDAFGLPGITVDTHVGRLSRRFGWTTNEDPVAVEADLAALFPTRDWTPMSHRVIFHGRRTCFARRPACGACPVARDCPSYGAGEVDPVKAAALVKGPPP